MAIDKNEATLIMDEEKLKEQALKCEVRPGEWVITSWDVFNLVGNYILKQAANNSLISFIMQDFGQKMDYPGSDVVSASTVLRLFQKRLHCRLKEHEGSCKLKKFILPADVEVFEELQNLICNNQEKPSLKLKG